MLCVLAQPLLWLLAWPMLGTFERMGHAPEQVALEQPYFLTFIAGGLLFLIKTVSPPIFPVSAAPAW
jgi:MATE family multidrug resistance protein